MKTIRECSKHGMVEFAKEKQTKKGEYRLRCKKCNYEKQLRARRLRKKELVKELGGCCEMCGYSRCVWALDFHHRNPEEKEFGIGRKLTSASKKRLLLEVKKCSLLCRNCHAEVEAMKVVK